MSLKRSWIISVFACCIVGLHGYAGEAGSPALAQERERLLSLPDYYKEAERAFASCGGTQLDLNVAAAHLQGSSLRFLREAVDWRIRAYPEQRREILNDYSEVRKELRRLEAIPRDGSARRVAAACRVSSHAFREARRFLDFPNDYRKKMFSYSGVVDGKPFTLKNGRSSAVFTRYGQAVQLEIFLTAEYCFPYRGMEFAVLQLDVPESFNNDFLQLYLCGWKDGKMKICTQLDTFLLEKVLVTGDRLLLTGTKTHQEGPYRKEIDLTSFFRDSSR